MNSLIETASETISRLTTRQGIRQSGIGRKVVSGASVLKREQRNMLLAVLLLGVAGVGGYLIFKNIKK